MTNELNDPTGYFYGGYIIFLLPLPKHTYGDQAWHGNQRGSIAMALACEIYFLWSFSREVCPVRAVKLSGTQKASAVADNLIEIICKPSIEIWIYLLSPDPRRSIRH